MAPGFFGCPILSGFFAKGGDFRFSFFVFRFSFFVFRFSFFVFRVPHPERFFREGWGFSFFGFQLLTINSQLSSPPPPQFRDNFPAVPLRANPRPRQQRHGHENHQQSQRRRRNILLPLRQNRKSSIHKFNVYPIHQQRRLPHRDHRTESPLPRSPPAPRISRERNHHHNSRADQKKVWTRVPKIINRIDAHRQRVKPQSQPHANRARASQNERRPRLPLAPPIARQEKSRRQARKRESRPRK